MPEFGCLPIDSPHETPNHRPRRLLDLRKSEIRDLGRPFGSDEDVRRLAIAMNDRGLVFMEILQSMSNVKHNAQLYERSTARIGRNADRTYNFVKRWRRHVSNVVKEVAIGAELADDHDRRFLRVLGDTNSKLEGNHEQRGKYTISVNAYKSNNVWMCEFGEEFELLDVHCRRVNSISNTNAEAVSLGLS